MKYLKIFVVIFIMASSTELVSAGALTVKTEITASVFQVPPPPPPLPPRPRFRRHRYYRRHYYRHHYYHRHAGIPLPPRPPLPPPPPHP